MRWALFGLLASLSALIIVGNPLTGWIVSRRGQGYSSVPFIGGLFGLAACFVCPLQGSGWLAPVPLLLDYTIPVFAYLLLSGKLFHKN